MFNSIPIVVIHVGSVYSVITCEQKIKQDNVHCQEASNINCSINKDNKFCCLYLW